MEKSYGRNLVALIGGYRQNNENRKTWLARVARTTGITVRQTYAAFYREYVSKSVAEKLQQAARKRVSEDDSELILRIHAHIRYLESVDSEMYRADIDAARKFVARYQDFASTRVFAPVPPGFFHDC